MIRKNAFAPLLISTIPHAHASKCSQYNDHQSLNFTYHRKTSFATNPKPENSSGYVTTITRKYTLYFVQNQVQRRTILSI